MTQATLTSKGRITLPAPVRAALGVMPGDRVEFVEFADGRFEIVGISQPITALKGMFGPAPSVVSIEEMNALTSGSVKTPGTV